MTSSYISQMLYDWQAVMALMALAFCQALGWRFWLGRARKKSIRFTIHLIYLLFNMAWALTVPSLFYEPLENLNQSLWLFIYRPALAWQIFHLVIVFPFYLLWGFFALLALLGRKVFFRRQKSLPDFAPQRRDFLKTGQSLILGTALAFSTYGLLKQSRKPQLGRTVVEIKDLAPELRGLKIAHLTDPHLGLWSQESDIHKAMLAAAQAKPDIVFITGDWVDRNSQYAKLYRGPLALFNDVPHGVFGVLGNHDHYYGPERIFDLLNGHGVTMLSDQALNHSTLPLTIIGLEDPGTREKLFSRHHRRLNFDEIKGPSAPKGNFTILLNHRPEGAGQAEAFGCGLYLSGHTHGGQYQAPWDKELNLARPFYEYTNGLYRVKDMWLNVSPGLASVGLPFRLFAWPRVDIITLMPKAV